MKIYQKIVWIPLLLVFLTGCEVVEDILEFGFWVIFIVVILVVLLVVWLIKKLK